MNITDHGVFTLYAPTDQGDAPYGALFCQNEQKQDWYQLQNLIAPGAALVEVDQVSGRYMGATGEYGIHDYSTRWPGGKRLLEVRPAESVSMLNPEWVYQDGEFKHIPLTTPIPAITPRQLRLWLLKNGLLERVPDLIAALPEPDRSAAQIEWEYAASYTHDNPLVKLLGEKVKMTEADIEAAFREAAKL